MVDLATCPNVMVKLSGLTSVALCLYIGVFWRLKELWCVDRMPSTGFRWETRERPPSSKEARLLIDMQYPNVHQLSS